MKITTWCGSVIETQDYGWTVWLRWIQGWVTAGWRPFAFQCRARERERTGSGGAWGATLGWIALGFVATIIALSLIGCGDQRQPDDEMPSIATCIDYETYMVSVDEDVVPSLVPAPFGVRIVVDPTFHPFMGASYPVPGGRMVWNVWVFRWYDGDHLGAIGRVGDSDVCRWYQPR